MKLDKMQFASVVAYVANIAQRQTIDSTDINVLDDLIDIPIPIPAAPKADPKEIDNLLMLMAAGTQKIEAIKAYRQLTGEGLKESKDVVEKYWINIKPNSYTYSELKDKIGDKFNTDEVTVIMRFIDPL